MRIAPSLRSSAAKQKTIFGIGTDLAVPILLLIGLGVVAAVLKFCVPAARRAKARRRDKRRRKGKHVEISTVDEDDQDEEEAAPRPPSPRNLLAEEVAAEAVNKRNARRAAKRAELREERRSGTAVVFWLRDDCRLRDNAGLAAAAALGAVVPVFVHEESPYPLRGAALVYKHRSPFRAIFWRPLR